MEILTHRSDNHESGKISSINGGKLFQYIPSESKNTKDLWYDISLESSYAKTYGVEPYLELIWNQTESKILMEYVSKFYFYFIHSKFEKYIDRSFQSLVGNTCFSILFLFYI